MSQFEEKTILITGGTGSFGGYFVNYLLDKDFKEIRVFSRDELKQDEMRQKLQNTKIRTKQGLFCGSRITATKIYCNFLKISTLNCCKKRTI